MDRNLSDRQVGELYSKFRGVDESSPGTQEKYETLVKKTEDKL